jgi:uncharacterized membrane protein
MMGVTGMFVKLSNKIRNWFPGRLEQFTLLVFVAFIDSLALLLGKELSLLPAIPYLFGFVGLFAYLFPVGWIALSLLFPGRKQVSMVGRVVLSIALSIALSNLALQIIYYTLPLPLNVFTNLAVLFGLGSVLFVVWVGRRVKQHATRQ